MTAAAIEETTPVREGIEQPTAEEATALGLGSILTAADQRNLRARARWYDGGAIYATPMFEQLSDAEYHAMAAYHEAGHAVVGILFGLPLLEAVVGAPGPERRGRVIHRGIATNTGSADSYVTWGPYANFPCERYNAMCWAGQRAQRRAVADRGWLNPDTDLDVRIGGWHDAALVLCVAERTGLPEDDGLAEADELVDQYWPVIEEVTAALIAAERLDGALVHRMVTR